jgi:hypothetical protein
LEIKVPSLYLSCLQINLAASSFIPLLQTLPHLPFILSSNLPLKWTFPASLRILISDSAKSALSTLNVKKDFWDVANPATDTPLIGFFDLMYSFLPLEIPTPIIPP